MSIIEHLQSIQDGGTVHKSMLQREKIMLAFLTKSLNYIAVTEEIYNKLRDPLPA